MTTLVHPEARIGHVHLKNADLYRATDSYSDVLGIDVHPRIGDGAGVPGSDKRQSSDRVLKKSSKSSAS